MRITQMWASGLCGAVLFLGGCASAPYKPAAMSERDVTLKLHQLRHTCESVKMGSPVEVTFYSEDIDPKEIVPGGRLTGYLYACNKWNNTISVSQKPLTFFDRGTPYYLAYVDNLQAIAETALLPPLMSELNPMSTLSNDPAEAEAARKKLAK